MSTKLTNWLSSAAAIATLVWLTGCASTGTNFDDSKVALIKEGQTTEAELIQMFGEPETRIVQSGGEKNLIWSYHESVVKGESFIPYAGPFVGGTKSKGKMLNVTLGGDGTVKNYSASGSGSETRQSLQSVPK